MDPFTDRPALLSQLSLGRVTLTWRADLGRGRRLETLSEHLRDLDMVVSAGERWGVHLASVAPARQRSGRFVDEGNTLLEGENTGQQSDLPEALYRDGAESGSVRGMKGLASLLLRRGDLAEAERWFRAAAEAADVASIHQLVRLLVGRGELDEADRWINAAVDAGAETDTSAAANLRSWFELMSGSLAGARRVPRPFGEPVTVAEVSYRNPLEVVLGGSGFLIAGAIWLLRIARDWSSARRSANAQATIAENAARRSTTHADLAEWLVDEAMQGRLHVAPRDLVNLVTRPELQALDRLADTEVSLELPLGTADASR